LVLVCNPNNPTSTALPLEEIAAFLDRVPGHVCVVLDEAYCEFSLALGDPYASVDLLARHPNLVLLRTFSKVYGLAGTRVGYALCGTDTFRVAVDQVRQPFYLNAVAQAAAVEALRHQDEVERRVVATVAGRGTLMEGVRSLGLWVAESDANFIWVRLPAASGDDDAAAVEEARVVGGLRERRVLVRAGGALGEAGCLRVTVGTDLENERFLGALSALVGA
jgi:histidinol-phosphate aminotransferase